MKSAHVKILGDPGPYIETPFRGEFNQSSISQIKEYLRSWAQAEGLKNYEVVIDGEVYVREVTPEYLAEHHPEWLESKQAPNHWTLVGLELEEPK